ncbi:MAG TPA: S-methyl-5-thioribose-1-phosphate isomerase [Candidatus Limnocylindrales bacterium]|nr:S-methyl-5-thioribose-1-phosphate isomerase [Candidatus Limnocylindrales bacterium]
MSGSPPDPSRRRFFRQFAGEVVASAAQVVGAVAEVRDRSAAEAQSLLSGDAPVNATARPGSRPGGRNAPAGDRDATAAAPAAPTGFRTPFRFDADDTLLVIDQRELPEALVELPVKNAYDGARVIRDMAVRGAPAIGQVAALSLALSGWLARNAPPRSREAIVRAAAKALAGARPTAVNLGWAVGRVMAAFDASVAAGATGPQIAAAMRAEADRIVFEATDDHGRLADFGLAALPNVGDRELRILTHCNTGPLACGQFGTALGVVQAAHHAERPVHVWVDETRPYLQGARLTAWELAQAGVPHTLIADGAAGSLIAAGRVDAILVGADRVAANGDTANKVGTYPLAVLAARHGVPFYVCAPMSSVDLDTPDGTAIQIEERPAREITEIRGQRIAPIGTAVWNPAFDVTPAELVSGIVTDEGVLRPPYEAALRAAASSREARRGPVPSPVPWPTPAAAPAGSGSDPAAGSGANPAADGHPEAGSGASGTPDAGEA